MTKQIIIAKIAHEGIHPRLGERGSIPINLVLRWGFSTMGYDPVTEDKVEQDFNFDPSIEKQDWVWTGSTFEQVSMEYCCCSKLRSAKYFSVMGRKTAPPENPAEGDCYLIKEPATDIWAGHENEVVVFCSHTEEWEFIQSQTYYVIYVEDEKQNYFFQNPLWLAQKERFVKDSLADDAIWEIEHQPDSNFSRIIQVFHDKIETDISLDFDEADEGQFTQEDDTKTSFEGDSLHLEGLGLSVYAHWHLNESAGSTATDSSGNGRNGTCINMEDADWTPGKLNNCLHFDGINEHLDCQNIGGFESDEPFSLECWFRTNSAGSMTILGKTQGLSGKGYYILMAAGKIYFKIVSSGTNLIYVCTQSGGYADDAWHHLVCTYDGSLDASGVHIYVDGSDKILSTLNNSLTATILNPQDFRIACLGNLTYYWNGYIDETVVYDAELTQTDVTNRWNGGAGTESTGYPIGGWYVYTNTNSIITSDWDAITSIAFDQTEPANTQLRYLVSVDNKVTWKKWTGAAWASEILANIHTAGNTKAQLEALTEATWDLLFSPGTLDIAVGLKTTDSGETPDLDQITIGYSLPGKYKCKDTEIDIILDSSTVTKIKNVSGATLDDLSAIIMV